MGYGCMEINISSPDSEYALPGQLTHGGLEMSASGAEPNHSLSAAQVTGAITTGLSAATGSYDCCIPEAGKPQRRRAMCAEHNRRNHLAAPRPWRKVELLCLLQLQYLLPTYLGSQASGMVRPVSSL